MKSRADCDTLPAMLGNAAARPDAGLHWDDRFVPYTALDEQSRRLAAGLVRLGVGSGDRVALWLPNTPAWLAWLFACARIGAVVVAVNTRFRQAEAGDLLSRSGARVVAIEQGYRRIDFLRLVREIAGAGSISLRHIVNCGVPEGRDDERLPGISVVRLSDLVSAEPLADDASSPNAGCAIFTTSGTTNASKLVLHRQAGLVRHAHDASRAFGYDAQDACLLQVLPLCGVFGFCQAMAGIAGRASMVVMSEFDAGAAGAAIRNHSVTHLNGTDDMFEKIFDANPGADPFPSLRRCGFAAFTGDPHALVARGEAYDVPLIGLYGMSEVQALFAARPVEAPVDQRALAGGLPVSAETRVRARDPESGRVLPDGEPGELEIAGPSMMAEYWGDPDATRDALTADGFFRTGDLGYTQKDGFVFQSRLGDVLRLSGFLVNPEEISSHIEEHPGVGACQVVGAATRSRLKPVAFVVLSTDRPVGEEELLEHCRAGLAHYKQPARVLFVDAFPVTESANGIKIQRAKLRELAEQELRLDAG